MRRAWDAVAQRHSALRTSLVWEGVSEPHQVVDREVVVPWAEADWRDCAAEEQAQRLRDHFVADRAAGFELDRAPLMRVLLIRVGDTRWKLFWTHHHLIVDGWSLPIVMNDVVCFFTCAA